MIRTVLVPGCLREPSIWPFSGFGSRWLPLLGHASVGTQLCWRTRTCGQAEASCRPGPAHGAVLGKAACLSRSTGKQQGASGPPSALNTHQVDSALTTLFSVESRAGTAGGVMPPQLCAAALLSPRPLHRRLSVVHTANIVPGGSGIKYSLFYV